MELLRRGMTGPQVEMLQLALLRAGYNIKGTNNGIDGIFGSSTYLAVREFQKDNGLSVDGIVGPATWKKLRPYITGYISYSVKPGDTFYKIARRYATTTQAVILANPGVSPNNLSVGSILNVPIGFYNGGSSVTYGEISYTWELMSLFIEGIVARYPFLGNFTIGRSVFGRDLFCLSFGEGETDVMYNASHHANEWITTPVLLKYIEDLARAYAFGGNVGGQNARELYELCKIYIVPMVNPDGVDLVNGYFETQSNVYQSALSIASNYPEISFPDGWKANIRGVDLNLNYPAGWEEAREIKFAQGFTGPAPRDFVGNAPFSEPESTALGEFTRRNNFKLTLSYHTQGKVIFWKYLDFEPEDSFRIGRELASVSGYDLEITPTASGYAGYKDWFIQEYNRPSYTVECGIGLNPLPVSQFDEIYNDNKPLLSTAAKEATKL